MSPCIVCGAGLGLPRNDHADWCDRVRELNRDEVAWAGLTWGKRDGNRAILVRKP